MQHSKSNHSTSKDYEVLVWKMIEQEMVGLTGVDLLGIQHNVLMRGLSGFEHQIDVAYRFRIWRTEMLVIVECKQYQTNVGIDDLLEFRARIDDLRAHKGIFVTTVGYQRGAIEFAKANRISLLVARGAESISILYSAPVRTSSLMQAEREISGFRESFASWANAVDSRMLVDPVQNKIRVHRNGVELMFSPGALRRPMCSEKECDFRGGDGNRLFFHAEGLSFLRPEKVFAAVILEILLDPSN